MNSIVKRRLILCVGGFVFCSLIILCASVGNLISVRQVGIAYIVLFVVAVLLATSVLGGSRVRIDTANDTVGKAPDQLQQRAALRTIRNYKVAVIVMLLILIYGLWDSKEFPLWVTIVGVVINIGITYVLVLTVRSKQARLDR